MNKLLTAALIALPSVAFAAEGGAPAADPSYLAPLGVALTLGVAAFGGALGLGKAISAAVESIGRNPGAAAPIRLTMIIGLVFIELAVILSFVIALQVAGRV